MAALLQSQSKQLNASIQRNLDPRLVTATQKSTLQHSWKQILESTVITSPERTADFSVTLYQFNLDLKIHTMAFLIAPSWGWDVNSLWHLSTIIRGKPTAVRCAGSVALPRHVSLYYLYSRLGLPP